MSINGRTLEGVMVLYIAEDESRSCPGRCCIGDGAGHRRSFRWIIFQGQKQPKNVSAN